MSAESTCRLVSLLAWACLPSAAAMEVEGLRCEHLENPLGLDATRPRLQWRLKSDARGQSQTAYQILAATSAERLEADRGDLWDSGMVRTDQTVSVRYEGKPLSPRQAAFWKVRAWDRDGKPGAWSGTAMWEAGLPGISNWNAVWIAATEDIHEKSAPIFRREFSIDGAVKRARLHVSGLGYHEIRLNGSKVGDHLLDPGFTRYDRRVLYVTHDVTSMLRPGRNAIGAMLGNGWFNVQFRAAWDFDKAPWRASPRLLCSLYVEMADGREMVIGSDAQWKCALGPVTFNVIYGGESHDARLEQDGWDQPGFDEAGWRPVQVADAPKGRLVAQAMPPIKAARFLKPVKITEPAPGIHVFEFPENFAGFAELKTAGPAGTRVTMKMGERLLPDGRVDQAEIAKHVTRFDGSRRFQTDSYILKGGEEEIRRPRFVYHGFQYVEVTGLPGKVTPDTLRGVVIHTDVRSAGDFSCSNPLLNQIWQASRRAYLANLQGIPTDCPHREKNGWTGDAHLACEQGLFNFDAASVYEKWLHDIADEQRPDGVIPGIVPTSGWGYKWGNGPAWDSAFLLIPLYLYQYHGDDTALREHYDGMKRYVDHLSAVAKDGIVETGLGDWAPFETKTPVEVTSTAYYHRDALVVSLAASLMGKTGDAAEYARLAERIKAAFNRKFYQEETGMYANGSQTALSCAIYQDLAAPQNRERVLDNLAANITRRGGHIDTGILGSKYILNVLSGNGRHDVAYRMAAQTDLPGWGWWIGQGATTLWEQWDGGMSRNHIMFGEISAWFFKHLAGINPDPAAPGFKRILIKPGPTGDLTAARAEYDSVRGRIISDWKIEHGRFRLRVVIPPNTTAAVHVPAKDAASVTEGGKAAADSEQVRFLRMEDGRAVFDIGSGGFDFISN
jgi:alpha-L-rhamnosidase